jgi:serine/threonine-protein kinase
MEFLGQVINGRYKVGHLLAHGGVALVYRGQDLELERPVAIKVLREERGTDQEFQKRLQLEARALAKLSHPNIVNLLDHGLVNGMFYLVMELVQGRTLGQVLRDGPMEGERAVRILRQILQTLQFAHAQGVLHRDLKPGNVFLQELPHTADHVKILDFGFAKFFNGPKQPNNPALTRVGMAVGTPAYMAPEQAAASEMDARTDLYAAGVIMFEILCGRRPFEGAPANLMREKVQRLPPRIRDVAPEWAVTDEVEDWLQKALARNPDDRFPDALTMLNALDALPKDWKRGSTTQVERAVGFWALARQHHRLFLAIVAIALLLAGPLAVGLVWRTGQNQDPAAPRTRVVAPEPAAIVRELTLHEQLGLPDPWAGEAPPPAMGAARALLEAGQRVDDSLVRELRSYARNHPDDPRPLLLLGHIFANRERRPVALMQYERALALDPNARGDTRMLANLVAFAARPGVGGPAARVIRQVYGPAAREVVEAALNSGHLNSAEQQRLHRLSMELTPHR